MKGIIVYQGKYGATAQYAEWLNQDLDIPVVSSDQCTELDIQDKNLIIMGTSVYVGKLQIGPWVKKNAEVLKGKSLFLFVVSGTPLSETDKLNEYVRNSLPPEIASSCHRFFLPGKLEYKKLSLKDKLVLNMGALLAGSKEKRKQMLTDYNDVSRAQLQQILNEIEIVLSSKKIYT